MKLYKLMNILHTGNCLLQGQDSGESPQEILEHHHHAGLWQSVSNVWIKTGSGASLSELDRTTQVWLILLSDKQLLCHANLVGSG
jgi:hypothetical protein